MNSTFLCIDTSTRNCSVAVFNNRDLLSLVEESSDQYIHGEKLHLFIERAVGDAGIQLKDLNAIAVTKGPGSYTGLRIGVSAAKGLAYSLNIPLYSTDSLQVLACGIEAEKGSLILANIDARRMEIYGAFYDENYHPVTPVSAEIVEEDIFTDIHKGKKVILAGDAQEKLMEVLPSEIYTKSEVQFPSARFMGSLIADKIESGESEDVAYFEPFYLKDFIAGKPRKSPLDL